MINCICMQVYNLTVLKISVFLDLFISFNTGRFYQPNEVTLKFYVAANMKT
jgi:hypothetical protein